MTYVVFFVDQDGSPMLHSLPQLSGSPVLRSSRFSQSTDLSSHRDQPSIGPGHSASSGKAIAFSVLSQPCRRPDPMDLLQQQLQQRFDLQRQKSFISASKVFGVGNGSKGSTEVSQTTMCVVSSAGGIVTGRFSSGAVPVSTAVTGECIIRPTSDISLSRASVQYERPSNIDRYSAPSSGVAVKNVLRTVAR